MLFFALVVPGLTEATEPPVEILPLKVFRKLQAGGKQTVVVYGTSVSIGGEWAQAVRDYFEARFPGQVTFINQAVSGKHSRWGLEQLDERVIAVKPDLLFLEFAINDAATKHGISTEACASNLDAMVQRVRAAHPSVEIVLQTMNAAWDSPVSAPKKYASDRPQLADYYAVYRRYAQDQGLPLLDHFPVWNHILLEEPARYQAMVPDGIHPGKEASLAVAWPPLKDGWKLPANWQNRLRCGPRERCLGMSHRSPSRNGRRPMAFSE
jgi:lysophospholipase L1-like esterase